MKHLDFDRAFAQTPDCIHAAIELGLRKGRNKMKFRNKIIAMGSIAAAFAVMLAAALALGIPRPETPDVLAQPPLEFALAEGVTVYTTESGAFYHAVPDCSGLENALEMPESEAIALEKRPCPVCIPLTCTGHENEIEFIYYSQGGKYFHRQAECSGAELPLKGEYLAVTEEYPGKEPCAQCFPNGIWMCLHSKAFAVEPKPTPTAAPAPQENTEVTDTAAAPRAEEYLPVSANESPSLTAVYTAYGADLLHYHRLQNCGGGDYRREITQAQALKEGLQPCEACVMDLVYYNEGGTYYHSDRSCQGMRNAKAHSRKDARSDRKSPCPLCLNVYSTVGGKYFHLLPGCIGMLGAQLRSLEEAHALGKTRCPVCLSPETVYATPKGNYFHAFSACSGMVGASPADPEDAWNAGKSPCPVCIIGEDTSTPTLRLADSSTQTLASLHEQLFQTAFGFLPEAKAQGYRFEEYSTEPYIWHLTDGESLPLSSVLYTPGGDYDGYRVHMFSGAHPTVMRQIMEHVAVSPMMGMYSLAIHGLKNHIINQGHSFSERDIDIRNILVKFDDAQRICGASIDFYYNQSIVSVAFTPENRDYLSWNADLAVNSL